MTRSTPASPAANRAQRRLPRLGRKHRVGIEPHRSLALAGPHALYPINVGGGMRERDRRLDVVAQRRLLAHQAVEGFVRQRLVDGAHTVGPLGMAGPRVMLNKARVGDQQGGHRGARNGQGTTDRAKASPAGVISQRMGSLSWGAAAVFFCRVRGVGCPEARPERRRHYGPGETPGRTPWLCDPRRSPWPSA